MYCFHEVELNVCCFARTEGVPTSGAGRRAQEVLRAVSGDLRRNITKLNYKRLDRKHSFKCMALKSIFDNTVF